MNDYKKAVLGISGGLGKHVMFSALLPALQKRYPDGVYLSSAYDPVFYNNPLITQLGRFDQLDFANLQETAFVSSEEPYSTRSFILKQSHLLDVWAELFGVVYQNNSPHIQYADREYEEFEAYYNALLYSTDSRPFILVQFTGGQSPVAYDEGGHLQMEMYASEPLQRAYPIPYQIELVQKLTELYPDHCIVRYGLPNELVPHQIRNNLITPSPMGYRYWPLLAEKADAVIAIDSSLQHLCAARSVPAVVIWGESSPEHFGWRDIHTNLREEQPNTGAYWSFVGRTQERAVFPTPYTVLNAIQEYIQ